MNGAGHFREAETDIAKAKTAIEDYDSADGAAVLLARAQVHATLALAAATAQGDAGVAPGDGQDRDAWDQVLGGGAA